MASTTPGEIRLQALRRVMHETGRALIHDLRGGLNMAKLGIELLAANGDGPALDAETRTSAEGSMRRGIEAAAADAAALHRVLVEATAPVMQPWRDAVRWALEAAAPVARRRGLDVRISGSAGDLPAATAPPDTALLLAWCLIETWLDAPRRATVTLSLDAAPGLDLTWPAVAGAERGQACVRAVAALADALGVAEHLQIDERIDARCLCGPLVRPVAGSPGAEPRLDG